MCTVALLLVLTVAVLQFFPAQGCAPYFSSKHWNDLKNKYDNVTSISDQCKLSFFNKAFGAAFSGTTFCTDILATQVFVADKCRIDCNIPTSAKMTAINCNSLTIVPSADVNKPESVSFKMFCFYTLNGLPQAPCLTPQSYTLKDMEDYIASTCLVDNSSTSAGTGSPVSGETTASGGTSLAVTTGSAGSGATTASGGTTGTGTIGIGTTGTGTTGTGTTGTGTTGTGTTGSGTTGTGTGTTDTSTTGSSGTGTKDTSTTGNSETSTKDTSTTGNSGSSTKDTSTTGNSLSSTTYISTTGNSTHAV